MKKLEPHQNLVPLMPTTCIEHGIKEPCPECLEREEATSFWLDCKRKDRERLDEYCETYYPEDSESSLLDSYQDIDEESEDLE